MDVYHPIARLPWETPGWHPIGFGRTAWTQGAVRYAPLRPGHVAIGMLVAGRAQVQTAAADVPLGPGDVFANAHILGTRISAERAPFPTIQVVQAVGSTAEALLDGIFSAENPGFHPRDPTLVARIFELIEAAARDCGGSADGIARGAWEALRAALRNAGGGSGDDTGARLVAQASAWLRGHVAHPDPVAGAAAAVGVGPAWLGRLFRRYASCTPSAYAEAQRLGLALRLVQEGGLPLRTIARRCGYAGAPNLVRAVRRCYGITPGQLRRSL